MNDLTQWLLDSTLPTIRYLTLRDLLDRPDDDAALRAERAAIMESGPVPAILDHQTETGAWQGERGYYTPKYVSGHWSMMLLGELYADAADTRVKRGVERILTDTDRNVQNELAAGTRNLSCLWGNILRYAVQFGYLDDPRTAALTDYLVRALVEGECPCVSNGFRSCAWGVVRTLWGLSLLPDAQRTPEVRRAIDGALDFILSDHALVEADYPVYDGGKIHLLWFKLNFPLFYQTDILFTLRVLGEMDALHRPEAAPALDWLESLRDSRGRWRGVSPYRSRTWKALGNSAETNRWVSLQAATILKRAGRVSQSSKLGKSSSLLRS